MPITGRFVADFADFYAAVQKADVSLKGLETGAGKVGASLNKMTDQFSGRKIIQDATLAAEAVQRIGGATMLTTAEQARLNAQINEALAKYKALGQEAPKSLTDLANATKQIATNTTNLVAPATAAGLSFKTLFSSFTAAGLATQVISKLTAEVTKMVDAGMRLPAIEQGFKRLNSSVGQNSQEMLTSLKTATKGMVTELDLMQSANKALLLGLPVTKQSMGELATAATALGRAMGMDATKSLDDLITALGRSSPMILDNLGLTVKVGEANEVYAKKLKKTVEELTDAEKKTAFYEAAMEAARKKTQELGDQSKTLGEIMTTVWTSIGNVVTRGVGEFNVGLGRMLSSWQKFKQAIEGSQGAGLGGAIAAAAAQEAADAEEAIRKARAAGRKDINLAIDIDPLTAFRKELDAIRVAMDKLTPTQRALIRDGDALNKSVKDIAKSLGVSEGAVEAYLDVLKKADAGTKKLGTTMEQAAAKGVKAFEDWHETLADLGFDMTILVAKRMQDLGEKSKAVLSDATARTAEWIKIMVKGLPVISGLGDELEKVGKIVKVEFKTMPSIFEKMRDAAEGFADGIGRLSQVVGGVFGEILRSASGVLQSFGDLADATDLYRRALSEAKKAGQSTFALTAQYALQATAAVVGYAQMAIGIIERLYDSLTGKEAQAALTARGGLHQLRTDAALAGRAFTDLPDTAAAFRGELVRLDKAIADNTARMDRYNLTWRDFRAELKQVQIDQFSRQLLIDFRAIEKQTGSTQATLRAMGPALSSFIAESVKAGTKIPKVLEPIIQQLIKMGELSEEAARAMLGMADDATPALEDIRDAAARYGATLDDLGPKVKQLIINEVASQIVKDWKTLSAVGADVSKIMGKAIQDVVNDALKLGLTLPESMKPIIQAMIDAGFLTDEFGNALTETSRLNFAKPLAEKFDELIAALKDLIDHMSKVGTAAEEGFGRARGAAEALGRAIPRGSVPGAPEPDTGTPGRPPAVPRPEGPGGPPSNSDDRSRVDDDAGAAPGPPGRKNPNPSTADIAAMMASARMPAFADSQSLGRVLPFPSPALTPAEAALTAQPSVQTGTGTVVHVHVDLDGREIAEAQVPYLPDAVKRYGLA